MLNFYAKRWKEMNEESKDANVQVANLPPISN